MECKRFFIGCTYPNCTRGYIDRCVSEFNSICRAVHEDAGAINKLPKLFVYGSDIDGGVALNPKLDFDFFSDFGLFVDCDEHCTHVHNAHEKTASELYNLIKHFFESEENINYFLIYPDSGVRAYAQVTRDEFEIAK